jgi:DnaJ-class molecular chaperone
VSTDPDVLDKWDPWETCLTCGGEGTIRDANDLDVDCPACDGDGGFER